MDNKSLLELAEKARENCYTPYSNFNVGAALLTKSGKVFTGCNIEIASFGGTNCAERTAIFKAVSEGYRDIDAIAVASSKSEDNEMTFPCGICRQVIAEFGKNIRIILGYSKGDIKEFTLEELLPYSFGGEDLPNKI